MALVDGGDERVDELAIPGDNRPERIDGYSVGRRCVSSGSDGRSESTDGTGERGDAHVEPTDGVGDRRKVAADQRNVSRARAAGVGAAPLARTGRRDLGTASMIGGLTRMDGRTVRRRDTPLHPHTRRIGSNGDNELRDGADVRAAYVYISKSVKSAYKCAPIVSRGAGDEGETRRRGMNQSIDC